eukprot:992861-Amphidinium_carterae.1
MQHGQRAWPSSDGTPNLPSIAQLKECLIVSGDGLGGELGGSSRAIKQCHLFCSGAVSGETKPALLTAAVALATRSAERRSNFDWP